MSELSEGCVQLHICLAMGGQGVSTVQVTAGLHKSHGNEKAMTQEDINTRFQWPFCRSTKGFKEHRKTNLQNGKEGSISIKPGEVNPGNSEKERRLNPRPVDPCAKLGLVPSVALPQQELFLPSQSPPYR